jgi:hypothetical protein
LPDRVVKRANRRSTRLPHGLNSSGGVPEPDGPASGDGSVSGGGDGAARVGEVGEVDDVVSVRGASGPWGRPVDKWRWAPFGESLAPQQGW